MNTRTRTVVGMGVILAALLGNGCASIVYEDGVDAYRTGDYVTAAQKIAPEAERGVASAQFYMGVMYRDGKGVPQDYGQALEWFRKAADQGEGSAQTNLGVMYEKGEGTRKAPITAVKWYRKAAEQGYTAAQYDLGAMYYKARGPLKDDVLAYAWLHVAATNGYARAATVRDRVATKMKPAQIVAARKLARKFLDEYPEAGSHKDQMR